MADSTPAIEPGDQVSAYQHDSFVGHGTVIRTMANTAVVETWDGIRYLLDIDDLERY